MDFKHYRKNVRHGPVLQKAYERWVMNDGVDPEDGDEGQQQNRQENGAGGEDNQMGRGKGRGFGGRGRGRGFWGRGRRQRGYRARFKGYGIGNQFHFHIF